MPYRPGVPPSDPKELSRYLQQEQVRIQQAIDAPVEVRQWRVLYAPPEKYGIGMECYADGTMWNPSGTGEGLHVYTSAGWRRLNN